MEDYWRAVVGYEGYYEVSRVGEVRRIAPGQGARPGLILRPGTDPTGHKRVSLTADRKKQTRKVHRLVLEAFVGPCPDGMEGCHENDIAGDNRLDNLRWDTRRANRLDCVRNGGDHNASKRYCDRGHEYTAENTRLYLKRGSQERVCIMCIKEGSRRHYLRKIASKVSK